jgi:hypothetical protein
MTKRMAFFTCRGCRKDFPRPDEKRLYCSLECQFLTNVRKTEDCWLWEAGTHKFGYGEFRSRGVLYRAHRFSYELAFGPIGPGVEVLHTCDNPRCVNPDHLYIGSQADNGRDTAVRDRVGTRKLTPSDVHEIRHLIDRGDSLASIARTYGVSGTCIGWIKTGKNWKYLSTPDH